jgi:hypothetical protein
MTCADARDAIEIAELSELRGDDDSPLAGHLRECAECRRLADVVLRGTSALTLDSARRARTHRTRVRRVTAWSSVAAAATIVAAVVVDRRQSTALPEPRRSASLPVARQVSLEVARGQQATVLKTSDPKVTVIWLSSGEGK